MGSEPQRTPSRQVCRSWSRPVAMISSITRRICGAWVLVGPWHAIDTPPLMWRRSYAGYSMLLTCADVAPQLPLGSARVQRCPPRRMHSSSTGKNEIAAIIVRSRSIDQYHPAIDSSAAAWCDLFREFRTKEIATARRTTIFDTASASNGVKFALLEGQLLTQEIDRGGGASGS